MRALADCEQISNCVLIEKADVSKCDEATRLVHRAVDEFGRLDVLINNAARVADKSILEMTESEWDSVVDVSMKGAFLCSQAAARQMLGQDDGGTILNIGASTGITARRNGINTCAAKAGLMIMTQCLALELSPKIRVNTIIPGLTVTAETERRFKLGDPAVRRQREGAIPLQRIGQHGGCCGCRHAHALRRRRVHHRSEARRQRRPVHVVISAVRMTIQLYGVLRTVIRIQGRLCGIDATVLGCVR